MKVRLSRVEMLMGGIVGQIRTMEALRLGCRDDLSITPDQRFGRDVLGALAEMAVCRVLGVYWTAMVNAFKAPDVLKFQVRHTYRPDGCLIVRPDDADRETYILVVGAPPDLDVVGFIAGADAKVDLYLKAPAGRGEAYFVPQKDLIDIEALIDMVKSRYAQSSEDLSDIDVLKLHGKGL